MRRLALLAVVLLASACAAGSGRVETLSRAPSFRVKGLALAPARGARAKGAEIVRALGDRLEAGGLKAAALEETDSVLAGSALSLDVASNPRVLAEIRSATGADAVVFLTLDPAWRSLDVAALDLSSGEPVLRATARPRGDAFASPAEVAAAAAEALSALSPERAKAAAAASAGDGISELDVP